MGYVAAAAFLVVLAGAFLASGLFIGSVARDGDLTVGAELFAFIVGLPAIVLLVAGMALVVVDLLAARARGRASPPTQESPPELAPPSPTDTAPPPPPPLDAGPTPRASGTDTGGSPRRYRRGWLLVWLLCWLGLVASVVVWGLATQALAHEWHPFEGWGSDEGWRVPVSRTNREDSIVKGPVPDWRYAPSVMSLVPLVLVPFAMVGFGGTLLTILVRPFRIAAKVVLLFVMLLAAAGYLWLFVGLAESNRISLAEALDPSDYVPWEVSIPWVASDSVLALAATVWLGASAVFVGLYAWGLAEMRNGDTGGVEDQPPTARPTATDTT